VPAKVHVKETKSFFGMARICDVEPLKGVVGCWFALEPGIGSLTVTAST